MEKVVADDAGGCGVIGGEPVAAVRTHAPARGGEHPDRSVAAYPGGSAAGVRGTACRGCLGVMSRRSNGEGSVYRRGDGRWTGAHYVLRPDGGRVRRAVYARTHREAVAKLSQLVAKTAAGVPLAVDSWTVESYASHWMSHVVAPRLRPATISSYRSTLRLHIVPGLGRYPLRRLTPTHVRALLAAKQEAGLSVRSVQIIHSTLRAMLAEAMRDEVVERNVAALVRPPRAEQVEVQPLDARRGWPLPQVGPGGPALRAVRGWASALGCDEASCWGCSGSTSTSSVESSMCGTTLSGSTATAWSLGRRSPPTRAGTSHCLR